MGTQSEWGEGVKGEQGKCSTLSLPYLAWTSVSHHTMLLDREAGYLSSTLGVAVSPSLSYYLSSLFNTPLNLRLTRTTAGSNQSNPTSNPLHPSLPPIPIPPFLDPFPSPTHLLFNPFRHLPLFHPQPQEWLLRTHRRFYCNLDHCQNWSKSSMG